VLGRNTLGLGTIAAIVVGWAQIASAATLLTMDGWRHLDGPSDFHLYVCERDDCTRGSKVIARLDSTEPAEPLWLPLRQRNQEATVSQMFGEPPGPRAVLRAEPVDARGHVLMEVREPNGPASYYVFSIVSGSQWQAAMTSLSSDKEVSQSNLERFEAALRAAKDKAVE